MATAASPHAHAPHLLVKVEQQSRAAGTPTGRPRRGACGTAAGRRGHRLQAAALQPGGRAGRGDLRALQHEGCSAFRTAQSGAFHRTSRQRVSPSTQLSRHAPSQGHSSRGHPPTCSCSRNAWAVAASCAMHEAYSTCARPWGGPALGVLSNGECAAGAGGWCAQVGRRQAARKHRPAARHADQRMPAQPPRQLSSQPAPQLVCPPPAPPAPPPRAAGSARAARTR